MYPNDGEWVINKEEKTNFLTLREKLADTFPSIEFTFKEALISCYYKMSRERQEQCKDSVGWFGPYSEAADKDLYFLTFTFKAPKENLDKVVIRACGECYADTEAMCNGFNEIVKTPAGREAVFIRKPCFDEVYQVIKKYDPSYTSSKLINYNINDDGYETYNESVIEKIIYHEITATYDDEYVNYYYCVMYNEVDKFTDTIIDEIKLLTE